MSNTRKRLNRSASVRESSHVEQERFERSFYKFFIESSDKYLEEELKKYENVKLIIESNPENETDE